MTEELSRAKRRQMREILERLEVPFAARKSFKLTELVRGPRKAEPIHNWLHYREGFSPKLVEHLLADVPSGGLILDPFCGVGTTLLAARDSGFPSVGLDTNPLAVFAARVKTRRYMERERHCIREGRDGFRGLRLSDMASQKPLLRGIDRLFVPDVLHALLVVKKHIDGIEPEWARDFFLLGWLSILENLSNVRRDGGAKFRHRRRLHTGGYSVIPPDDWAEVVFPSDRFGFVIGTFIRRIEKMLCDLDDTATGQGEAGAVAVSEGDALELDRFTGRSSVSLIVSSPPYPNTLSYTDAYKLELWMGGFVTTYKDRQRLNRQSLRSHLQTPLGRPIDQETKYPVQLDSLIGLMDAEGMWHPGLPKMLESYFRDMAVVLEKAYDALKHGGRCVLVVGTSAYGNIVIPTDTLLAKMAQEKGFEVERIGIVRHLPTSSQQSLVLKPFRHYLRESVLLLAKG